jgi:putative DNA methylase
VSARPRKLIEAALPVEAMNLAGRAEKAVPKKGLPATMHLWWSRKPTGLARAVLFASVIDDPVGREDLWPSEDERHKQRGRLLDLVADLSAWDCPEARLGEARRLLRAQYGSEPPLVIDPFCGGGAIPLEATRLGLPARAIDLSPVAALITKGLIEIPASVGGLGPVHPAATRRLGRTSGMEGVGDDVQRYGEQLIQETERRIGASYPTVRALSGSPTKAVSYLWARTATCTNPRCRAELPLLSTWWLSKRAKSRWHVRPVVGDRRIDFAVHEGSPPGDLEDLKVSRGANFRCAICGEVTDATEIRGQGEAGAIGLRLVAIQTFADPSRPRGGRAWTNATPEQESAAREAWPSDKEFPLPSFVLPAVAGNIHSFGIHTIEDLLTPRQRLLMVTMCEVLADLRSTIEADAAASGIASDRTPLHKGGCGVTAYAEAVASYLGLAISRMANRVSTMTIHNRANGSVEQSFVQPAYAFYGDFPEANPFSGSTGSWGNSLEHVAAAAAALPAGTTATVSCTSALDALPGLKGIVSTDPPYYDMFDYSALSNLFYPWLRLALGTIWPDETASLLAPEADQIVSNAARFGGDRAQAHDYFESRLRDTFKLLKETQLTDYPLTLYYGYQQTEQRRAGRSSTAWEALLDSLIDSGFSIVSTWPLRTERPEGVKTGSNALASSILLVCRERPDDAPSVSRKDFLSALRASLPDALATLRESNIAPVDLAQSAIGPGMAVYSSFRRVIEADGSTMTVRAALEHINHVLDEIVSGTESEFDADTRWAITWFEEFGLGEGPYGQAEQLSKSRNTSVVGLAQAGLIAQRASKVRLVAREELPAEWFPDLDDRLTVWEMTQHLIRRLEFDGEERAARLLVDVGSSRAELAKDLAYRLFLVCDRKGWAKEAASYNGLVTSWPELQRLAGSADTSGDQGQLL